MGKFGNKTSIIRWLIIIITIISMSSSLYSNISNVKPTLEYYNCKSGLVQMLLFNNKHRFFESLPILGESAIVGNFYVSGDTINYNPLFNIYHPNDTLSIYDVRMRTNPVTETDSDYFLYLDNLPTQFILHGDSLVENVKDVSLMSEEEYLGFLLTHSTNNKTLYKKIDLKVMPWTLACPYNELSNKISSDQSVILIFLKSYGLNKSSALSPLLLIYESLNAPKSENTIVFLHYFDKRARILFPELGLTFIGRQSYNFESVLKRGDTLKIIPEICYWHNGNSVEYRKLPDKSVKVDTFSFLFNEHYLEETTPVDIKIDNLIRIHLPRKRRLIFKDIEI